MGAVPTSVRSQLSGDSAAVRIIEALLARGIDTFFGIPGGPICPIFEAIRLDPRARLIQSRHETHAAFSAAAYQRSTGRVPAVVVTAGPGITNVVTGIASASMERIPMLVISGDVAWASHGGCLAQDSGPSGLHAEHMLASVTRRRVRVGHARSAVTQTLAALDAATAPSNPGPSLVILPIDQATKATPEVSVPRATITDTMTVAESTLDEVAAMLAAGQRPLVVLGAATCRHPDAMRRLVDALEIPFLTTPRAKGVVDEDHPYSLRNGGMAASLWSRAYTADPVDVALALGTDLDDTSMGPTPCIGKQGKLIHVDLDPAVFNRNVPTALGVTAHVGPFADQLARKVIDSDVRNPHGGALIAAVREGRAHDVEDYATDDSGDGITPHRAIADLQHAAGPRARFITDIGEHMLFALHYLRARGPDDFMIQLNLGSMGSGIAGAIGLALGDRERPVVCICGDGGMHMSGMEILTAVRHELPIVYAVFNDGRYNMVHHGMKQIFGDAEHYDAPPVDFTAWAASMGVPALTVTRGGELDPSSLQRLRAPGGPVLIDLHIDRSVRVRGGGRVEALQHMSMLAQAAGGEGGVR